MNNSEQPATKFEAEDVSGEERLDGLESKENLFNRLSVWHSANWNGTRIDEKRVTNKAVQEITDAIAGQMELTDFQKDRSKRVISSLPPRFNEGRSSAVLALVVCALVANDDGRGYHYNQIHPQSDDMCPNEFQRLAREIDVSYKEVSSCWRDVQREVF